MIQQQTNSTELLRQLVGEWSVGIALKKSEDKIFYGCGDMTALEIETGINSEIETKIEGFEDYYENSIWSYDPDKNEVHLFSVSSDGEFRDHVGKWVDPKTLQLYWQGTFEDQDQTEQIRVYWANKNQIDLREIHRQLEKVVLTVDYVFKRKTSSKQLSQDSH